MAELPLQVTVAPFTGCPFNVTCPYTEAVGVSDNANGAAMIARRVANANAFNNIFNVLKLSIDSPLSYSRSRFEWSSNTDTLKII